jgi:hypothetical protein
VIVAVANPGYSAGCRKYLQPDGVTFTEVAPPLEIDQERARCEPLSDGNCQRRLLNSEPTNRRGISKPSSQAETATGVTQAQSGAVTQTKW